MSSIQENTVSNDHHLIHTPDSLHGHLNKMKSLSGNTYKPSRSMKFALQLLSHMKTGHLDVVLPNEEILRFKGKASGPSAILRVHNDRLARRFFLKGHLGFCEAYLDGDWSSPDVAAFFKLMLMNVNMMRDVFEGKRIVRWLSYFTHLLKPNTRAGSKRNIYSHYDIGNDFYERWLDESMTYSSGIFDDDTTDLKSAQDKKYQELIDRLDLKPGHHVLEIGCGWGGFAEYAARNVGCRITAITVSEAQFRYAKNRIQTSGLSDKVEIRFEDYRDIQGKFDRIASIEMFEAVGEKYWPTYFDVVKSRLKDSGKAVLQIITINERDFPVYRKNPDYIQAYIFPGGMLPSKEVLSQQVTKSGLKEDGYLSFGSDYAKTLKIWNQNFQKAWPDISSDRLNERFKRMWEQYLCYCEAGFDVGTIDVVQLNLTK